jgi:hypothetical protein
MPKKFMEMVPVQASSMPEVVRQVSLDERRIKVKAAPRLGQPAVGDAGTQVRTRWVKSCG